MLTAYQTAVTNLIQAPSSPTALISSSQLTSYINTARLQLAGDAECVRAVGAIATAVGVTSYSFLSVTNLPTSVQSILSIQNARLSTISNNTMEMRPWAWYSQYYLGSAVEGNPTIAAQLQQGVLGTIYFYPTPSSILTVLVDSVCLPINLVDDTTVEAIPYPWTDAVPFYAAWLALMSLQRQADADEMLARYKGLALRGRSEATPEVLPDNYAGGLGATIAASKGLMSRTPTMQLGGRGQ